ncbi:helix-turn-helix transcriptional regulator [Reichenbachiella versicolor]|uniref:helix-turn-helix transcriptional regulator n=1 Tax=Reichenbachiella versicolor TaxID=1821036 RepID=UPI000D6E7D7D|nr:AraC family transcriptional regulator [Reichenbachiella versicolor]
MKYNTIKTQLEPNLLSQRLSEEESTLLHTTKAKILNNLSNAYYDPQSLSEEMNMSHVQLTRKIKALTGYTPVDLIKYYRLEYASVLLLETNDSIKEITYKTGFLLQGNFCRTFKKWFHKSPSDYRLEHKKEPLSFKYHCNSPFSKNDVQYLTWLQNSHPFIGQVLSTIIENIQQDGLNVRILAGYLAVEPDYIDKTIDELLSLSVKKFIKNVRLQYAAEALVYDDASVTSIGYTTGFFDTAHFSRSFKEAYDCTPSVFRSTIQKGSFPPFLTINLLKSKKDKTSRFLYNQSKHSEDRFV